MSKFIRALIPAILLLMAVPAAYSSSLYFPTDDASWATIDPASADWSASALDAALDYAGESKSSGVLVLLDGKILAEQYWTGDDAPTSRRYDRMVRGTTVSGASIEDVASAQKNIVSFLIGVAEGKGLVDLDLAVTNYLGVGWSKAKSGNEIAITVRHLMSMSSGLDDALVYQKPAGRTWRYNTGAYSQLVKVLESATKKDINVLTREWLTTPTGMSDSTWAPRPWAISNNAANKIGFATSAHDLARFGLVIISGGEWNGVDLLHNPTHLKEALSTSQPMNRSYGLLWWLNGQSSFKAPGGRGLVDGSLVPTAPDDMVAAQGALGRKLYIVPSMNLIVTRLGDAPGANFNSEFWTLLMKAAPRKKDGS